MEGEQNQTLDFFNQKYNIFQPNFRDDTTKLPSELLLNFRQKPRDYLEHEE